MWNLYIQSGTKTAYFPCTSVFPRQYHFICAPYSYFIYRPGYVILTRDSFAQENKSVHLSVCLCHISTSTVISFGHETGYSDRKPQSALFTRCKIEICLLCEMTLMFILIFSIVTDYTNTTFRKQSAFFFR
jgi:hypothetical protein